MAKTASLPPWLATLAVLCALFAALMSAGVAFTLNPVRAEAHEGEFDTRTALARLERILGDEAPHPLDSEPHDRVREALLTEIRALGLSPEVREEFTCRSQQRAPIVDCGRVRNIVFSFGPPDGPAVLAAAHYDSVPAAPGASDDGLGLAVWLEAARILAHEPLQRRVIVLFSDGEEPGLLGAHVFAQDPAMAQVEALVNVEARGTRGPALFFESNQPNADAIAAFRAAPRPVANSIMADAYALLPNSTDVEVLTRQGLDIVNLALLDGAENYHTPQDSLASLDVRSVQHMGDTALAVTRRFASSADAGGATSLVYTDIASRVFVSAPAWLVQSALALCLVVALAATWRSGRAHRWRTLVAPLTAVLAAAALAFAVDFALRLVRPGENYAFAFPEPTRAWCILLAMLAGVLALMVWRVGRDRVHVSAAAMFWFALLGGAASLVVGGISILFVIPAACYALGWLISLIWKPAERIGVWSAAIVVVIVWAPILHLVEVALGLDAPLVLTSLVAVLLLPWFGALVQLQSGARWREAAGVVAVATVLSVIAAAMAPSRSEARPQPLNLSYFLDITAGEARVIAGSAERALPPQLRGAFSPEFILPGDRTRSWAAPADVEPVESPTLADMEAIRDGDVSRVRGRLVMNGAYRASIRIPVAALPMRVRVNGVETELIAASSGRRDFVSVSCQGRACDGADVEVELAPGGSTEPEWFIIGQTPGRQVRAAQDMRARRPATTTPIQFGDSVITLARLTPGD